MPLTNSMGSFKPLNVGGSVSAPLSDSYVRYVATSTPQFELANLQFSGAAQADQRIDYDSTGNTYTVLVCDGTTTGINYRTMYVNKYLSNRTLSVCKNLVFPTTSESIQSVNIYVDKTSNIPYVAVLGYISTTGTYRTTLMALDSSLNITWSKTYALPSGGGTGIWITKDPAQSYIYVFVGVSTIYIFNTSGTLLNTYDGIDIDVPYHSFSDGGGGPTFISGTKLAGGRGNATLGAGLTTITSASKRTLTTTNTYLGWSTHVTSTNAIYGTYYNQVAGTCGIYKTNFSSVISLDYHYAFTSQPDPVELTGITNDGTYLYVTGRTSTVNAYSYMFRFDMNLNYIDGYVLDGGTGYEVAYTPFYYNNRTYTTSIIDMWVMPSDMSTPGTGTYLVNGATYTKSSVSAPTRTTGSIAFSTTPGVITTLSPTLISQTLTMNSAANKLIFVGL